MTRSAGHAKLCSLGRCRKQFEKRMHGAAYQANEATLRAEEVRRRIEVGDVEPLTST